MQLFFQNKLIWLLTAVSVLLNIASWLFWDFRVREPDKLAPLFWGTALILGNLILAVLFYKKEPAASIFLLLTATIAQIFLLILMRYYYLVSGLI